MKAKVIIEFKGRPDSEALTRTIAKGDTIEGDLAEVAVRNKWAAEIKTASDAAKK